MLDRTIGFLLCLVAVGVDNKGRPFKRLESKLSKKA